ncbi:MAG: hypothetical protein IPL20_03230 [Saprospiraceae bacterium]|nr:hypothetical protein [Saprospiraceae bacterium]
MDQIWATVFFRKKPQEVLIVVNDSGLSPKDTNNLAKKGINVLEVDKLEKDIKNNNVFNHQFLVIGSLPEEKYCALLPHRVFIKTDKEIKELYTESALSKARTSEDIIAQVWKWREDMLLEDYKNDEENIKLTIESRPKLIGSKKIQSIFSDHLYIIIEKCNSENECLKEWNKLPTSAFYYEALSSKGQNQLPPILDEYNRRIPFNKRYLSDLEETRNFLPRLKVAESFLSRIIIIDERIQEAMEEKVYKIPVKEHFKMKNIYIPEKVSNNLDLKAEQININSIFNYIDHIKKIGNNSIPFEFRKAYDFIVIHYSILERAYASLNEQEKDKNDRKAWVNLQLAEYKEYATVIVTSGRGNVDDLPDHVRFVNVSSITTALIEIQSKYLLHQILYSSRKQNKK